MQDLSSKVYGGFSSLTGGESMAATNTVSVVPPFSAEGSESESARGVNAGTPGPVTPLPPADQDTLINDEVHPAAPYAYSEDSTPGTRWKSAPNEAVPGRSGTGPWIKVS